MFKNKSLPIAIWAVSTTKKEDCMDTIFAYFLGVFKIHTGIHNWEMTVKWDILLYDNLDF